MPNPSTLPVDVSQWAYAGLVAENGHLTADNARLNATLEQLSQELNTKSDAHAEAVKKNKLLEKKLENEHAKGVKLLEDERRKGSKLNEKWEAEKKGLEKQLGEKQSELDNLSNRIRNVKGAFEAYQTLEDSKLDALRSAHKEHTDRLEAHFKSELIRMTANVTQFLAGQRDEAIARMAAAVSGADTAGSSSSSGIAGGSGAAGSPGSSRPADGPGGPAEIDRPVEGKGKQREKQNEGRQMNVNEQVDIDPSFGDDRDAFSRPEQLNPAGSPSDRSTLPLPDPQPQPQHDRMVSSRSPSPVGADAGPRRSAMTIAELFGANESDSDVSSDKSIDVHDGSTVPTSGNVSHVSRSLNRQSGYPRQLDSSNGGNAEPRPGPAGISVGALSQQANRGVEGQKDKADLREPAPGRVDGLSTTALRTTGNGSGSTTADLNESKPNRGQALAAEVPVASSSRSSGHVAPVRLEDGDDGDAEVPAKPTETSSDRGVGRPANSSKLKRKNGTTQGIQGDVADQEGDGETIVLPTQTDSPVASTATTDTKKGKKRRVNESTPARSTRARASGSGSNGASVNPTITSPTANAPTTRQGQVQARRGSSSSRRNTPVGHHPILPLASSASARSDTQEERPTPFIFARTSARMSTSHVDTHISVSQDSMRELRLRTGVGFGEKQVYEVDIKPDMMMMDREDRSCERKATVDIEISEEDPFLQNTHTSMDTPTNTTIAGPNTTSYRTVSARSRQTSNNMNSASAKKRGRKRIPSVLGTVTLPLHLDDDDNDPLGLGFDPL